MARRRTELDFPSVRIEGALFPGDFLARIAHFGAPEQSESDYRIPKKLRLRDELGRYFRIAEGLWQDFQSTPAGRGRDSRKITVEAFLLPFLRQVLGFDDVVPMGTIELDGRRFPIGHAATGGRVPLILTARDEDLDEPTERYGDDHRRRSPFLLAQEYLNVGAALWAIVSNGKLLRVLRDNPSLTRPAYLEFDLERLFEERLYPDFAVLWLACHASRFGVGNTAPSDCALERWKSAAQQEGTRARERLRFGVADALRELGTGFLGVPGNTALRERIARGELSSEGFYQQLLRLIYRFLFLFTVEERGLIHPPTASKEAIELYRDGYSLAQLRALAAKRRHFDRHHDLWQALCITFSGLQKGESALGLPGLGGLFRSSECPDVDSADLPNRSLLQAIYKLAYFIEDGALVRVNYRDMGTEELGSIYEALLELIPEIDTASQPWRFRFLGDDAPAGETSVAGNARKLTGSYYTPDTLVQELIKSALEPVVATRLKTRKDSEAALLSIKVLDPACGSGHFLLAAARKLAENLAKLRALEGEPRVDDYRRALRDVVSHCIFGVDRNPLAMELARTALWLESFAPDRPLSFLDHHLRCGDAIVGTLTQKIIEDGVPDEAFKPLTGDARDIARNLARRNTEARRVLKRERERLEVMQQLTVYETEGGRVLEKMPEDSLEEVDAKREAFEKAHNAVLSGKAKQMADCFVAAFYVPKTPDTVDIAPTTEDLHRLLRNIPAREGVLRLTAEAAHDCQAFHWMLEFPAVFEQGGFDVLLGNPPWEVSEVDEVEFFSGKLPELAILEGEARKRAIARLERDHPALWASFLRMKRRVEAQNQFIRFSRRYPLTAVGKLNSYALFAETFARLVSPGGRAGFIAPTGIATDDSTKAFFEWISTDRRLISLLAYENEEFIFPSVHHAFRFALLTLSGESTSGQAELVFFARQPDQIHDANRRFRLTAEEFRLINPNTGTCPVFRSERDAELTKKIYRRVPVLINEAESEGNPWGIAFKQGLFNMTGDSALFKSSPADDRLPLYEAKMMHHYDHRWATYDAPSEDARDVNETEKRDPGFEVQPRYWVEERQVLARIARVPRFVGKAFAASDDKALREAIAAWIAGQWLQAGERMRGIADRLSKVAPCLRPIEENEEFWLACKGESAEFPLEREDLEILSGLDLNAVSFQILRSRSPEWLIAWRDITGVEKIRTTIATVLPLCGVGHTLPLFYSLLEDNYKRAALLANLNSIPLDYIARQKVGGTHLTYGYLKQFPIVAPSAYSNADLSFISERVLELTFTSAALAPFARDLGYSGAPFPFDERRRGIVRAELDAYFARLYGLTRDELRYVLNPADVMGEDYPSESFRVLLEAELAAFGEYRTGRLVLEAWDRLEQRQIAASRPAAARLIKPSFDVLPVGAWARPMADERAESGAVLGAILKAMNGAMPARQVRLTATLALQPRLLRPFLSTEEATTWRRLVGPEADALPQGTSAVIPRVDGAWGAAVRTLRANGSLVEATQSGMWAPGANVGALETAGWPDGRARFVLPVLERQATDAIVRELPTLLRDWIDAQAA